MTPVEREALLDTLTARAIEAFAGDVELPGWFRSIRPATAGEKASGIDLWVTTRTTEIRVGLRGPGTPWRPRVEGEILLMFTWAGVPAWELRMKLLALLESQAARARGGARRP